MPRKGGHLSPATKAKISRSLRAHYASSGRTTQFGGTQKRYTKGVKPQKRVRRVLTGHSLAREHVVQGVPGFKGLKIPNTVSEGSLAQSRKGGAIPLTETSGRRGSIRLSVGSTFIHDRKTATTLFVPQRSGLLSQKAVGKGYNFKAKAR
jgi:hypothetical protein